MKKIDIEDFPIYLVTLKNDFKRREILKQSFKKYYDKFNIIEAVDGRELNAREYFDKIGGYFLNRKKLMTPSEVGCTLSHIRALEDFMSSTSDFCLILEDDIIGSDRDIEVIKDLTSQLECNSLLICGGQDGLNRKFQLARPSKDMRLHALARFSYQFVFRTCCYVVSRHSARAILDFHRKKYLALADSWGSFFSGTDIRIYYSKVLDHPLDLSLSHIESERLLTQESFVSKLLSSKIVLRVAKRIFFKVYSWFLIAGGFKRLT